MRWRRKRWEDWWHPEFFDRGEVSFDFDEFFEDFEEELSRMEDQLYNLLDKAMKGELPSSKEVSPFVYGFSLRIGPDGKPQIQEFGNLRGLEKVPPSLEMADLRQPITDLIEGEKEIAVTIEMPGVEREDIDLETTEDKLIVKAKSGNRIYHKEIILPCKVRPEGATATYKNGVLDVRLPRLVVEKERKRLRIK